MARKERSQKEERKVMSWTPVLQATQGQGTKRIKILKGIITILMILIVLLLVIIIRTAPKNTRIFQPYTLALEGYEPVSVSVTPPNNILLTSGCKRIEATSSQEQTESIFNALGNITSERPNAHDLAKMIFSEYGIQLVAVKIDDFADGNYHSTLVAQQGTKVLQLDARPSDAIAIALRMQKPVYIKSEFFEILGEKIC
ncbi:MAG TPA: hypothetical protein HA282_04290 [Nanoarchaeota archaeon]|nr:bifunctional nuclease family protein [Candidatus Pacearchaeota archaeon]HIH33734.1 hypothetical protein [Nanoarchaeota archaeon]HIH51315.1 hypothetical protein [Nanoarchaeota archaeon]HIH66405.1 hypothetical protein [Nanoarchaeota archaeon]